VKVGHHVDPQLSADISEFRARQRFAQRPRRCDWLIRVFKRQEIRCGPLQFDEISEREIVLKRKRVRWIPEVARDHAR